MAEEIKILGKFEKVIYQSQEYGASIIRCEVEGESVTVTGSMLPTAKNIKYEFTGNWVQHPKYGKQFRCGFWNERFDGDRQGLIEYLASGLIKGIGRKTAEAIVAKFGDNTVQVLDNDITRLTEVRGISAAKLAKIAESYAANKASREVAVKLARYGISPKMAAKACSVFKEEISEVIEKRPYLLCMVPGISFQQADQIAEKTDEYERSYDRFRMAASYVLYQNENNGMKNYIGNRTPGSLGMQKDDFGKAMLAILRFGKINGSFICENTIRMIKEGGLVYRKVEDQSLLFLPGIHRIESTIADDLYRLCNVKRHRIPDIDRQIDVAEAELGIRLGEKQREAVRMTFENGLSLMVGPPGSGKTTTIKVIAKVYQNNVGENVQFLAPTGKAAARIRETSGYFATTVHSGLSIGTELVNDLIKDREFVFNDTLLCVDEMSMLDARTAYQLFSAIGDDCIVVLCGDPDQLQSVGAGAVLRDMLDSGCIPATKLDTVYRTIKGSEIFLNADRIRKGNDNLTYGDGFHFTQVDGTKDLENALIECYKEKIQEYGEDNVMLIVPFKEHDAGVIPLNLEIQHQLNPQLVQDKVFTYGKKGCYYRIGDLVMHLKNDPQNGVVNGDIGSVSDILQVDGEPHLIVDYADSTQVAYTADTIDECTLAYSYTVHKSQGSEAKCVITALHGMHSVMLRRNIIYTAITRAKQEVCIFGQKEALSKAIMTEDKSKRYTSLKMQLKMKFGEFINVGYLIG